MARLQRQRMINVGHRLGIVRHDEVQRRAAVPAFRISGRERYHLVEKVERDVVFLLLDRLLRPLHHEIDRGAAGLVPFIPDALGEALGGFFVALALQLGKQRVEAALLGFGRCRRFLRAARIRGRRLCGWGLIARRQLVGGECRNGQQGQKCQQDDVAHSRNRSSAIVIVKLNFT